MVPPLPVEVLHVIMAMVEDASTLLDLAISNKQFYLIAIQHIYMHLRFGRTRNGGFMSEESIVRQLKSYRASAPARTHTDMYARKLSLDVPLLQASEYPIHELLTSGTRLRTLVILYYQGDMEDPLTRDQIADIGSALGRLSHLKELDLRSAWSDERAHTQWMLTALALPSMRRLHLHAIEKRAVDMEEEDKERWVHAWCRSKVEVLTIEYKTPTLDKFLHTIPLTCNLKSLSTPVTIDMPRLAALACRHTIERLSLDLVWTPMVERVHSIHLDFTQWAALKSLSLTIRAGIDAQMWAVRSWTLPPICNRIQFHAEAGLAIVEFLNKMSTVAQEGLREIQVEVMRIPDPDSKFDLVISMPVSGTKKQKWIDEFKELLQTWQSIPELAKKLQAANITLLPRTFWSDLDGWVRDDMREMHDVLLQRSSSITEEDLMGEHTKLLFD